MVTVAVLRGGTGGEHEVSLRSGTNVIAGLTRLGYKVVDVFIDKKGVWHRGGKAGSPEQILTGVDVAWNVLHGEYGEEGKLQRILDRLGMPYTGSGAYASALAFNKILTKEELEKHGVRMPRHVVLSVSPDLEREAMEAFRAFSPPVVVKPSSSGSSVGVSLAKTFQDFWEALKEAFKHSPKVLVEEFIKGKEATAGVVEGMRGERHYALLPVEIVPPPAHVIFDYGAKYSGETMERVPGNFTRAETEELQRFARIAHEALGLRHYSRSDFVVTPRGVYFLESNNAAGVGMTNESLLPKSLNAAGITTDEFLKHVTERALGNDQ
ncbi:MAG: ATP-grasp domain-containing protein [Patescibacteria group bacterium]